MWVNQPTGCEMSDRTKQSAGFAHAGQPSGSSLLTIRTPCLPALRHPLSMQVDIGTQRRLRIKPGLAFLLPRNGQCWSAPVEAGRVGGDATKGEEGTRGGTKGGEGDTEGQGAAGDGKPTPIHNGISPHATARIGTACPLAIREIRIRVLIALLQNRGAATCPRSQPCPPEGSAKIPDVLHASPLR